MENLLSEQQLMASQVLENLRTRLLDLTARNRLLNFKDSKRGSLRIVGEFPDQLVEALVNEAELRFAAVPEPNETKSNGLNNHQITRHSARMAEHSKPSAQARARSLGLPSSYHAPTPCNSNDFSSRTNGPIQVLLYPGEMEATLRTLYQKAQSAIQEMGTNILYLVCGFLEWYESSDSDLSRRAPLFLIPVQLQRGRLNRSTGSYEFTLSYTGEDLLPNLSLREKLRIDFGMELPNVNEETTPESYFKTVQSIIKIQQPRWSVCRDISLSLLNFNKLLMYLDLDSTRWPSGHNNILSHPIVNRILTGQEDNDQGFERHNVLGGGEEYAIDTIELDKYPLVYDADSSQHSALIDAIDGKDMVIEGPPGTGKSQTITNLIAAAMAQGKTVLFVAEKLAALEVVGERLEAAGLGDFCLELHSHNSQKRKVLDAVVQRINNHNKYYEPSSDLVISRQKYLTKKEDLRRHADRVNLPWKNTGKTPHEIFIAAGRYRGIITISPGELQPDGLNGDAYDIVTHHRISDQVRAYQRSYQALSKELGEDVLLQEHPWYGAHGGELQAFDIKRIKDILKSWQVSLNTLRREWQIILKILGITNANFAETNGNIQALLRDLEAIPQLVGNEYLDVLPVLRGAMLERIECHLTFFEEVQHGYDILVQEGIAPEMLNDFSKVEQLLYAKEQLSRYIQLNVGIHTLSKAMEQASSLQKQLQQIEQPIQGIQAALGARAAEHLTISEVGIKELKNVVEIINDLDPSLWQYRNSLFDNDALDRILPRLRTELKELEALQSQLKDIVLCSELPDGTEIREIGTILAAGGPFRWFKQSWRNAKAQLLSYSSNPQLKYTDILEELEILVSFAEKRTSIEQNIRYQEALGEHWKGLDTDVDSLEALRNWYKRVRGKYGIGFSPKSSIGDAILIIRHNNARAICSLAEQGIQQTLKEVLGGLNVLRTALEPVSELHNPSALLIGSQGIIPRILHNVGEALLTCSPLISYETMPLEELSKRIERLSSLKALISEWQLYDLDGEVFNGIQDLIPGIKNDAYSALKNTTKLAAFVERNMKDNILADCIYRNASKEVFVLLAQHVETLRNAIESENRERNNFCIKIDLDYALWVQKTDRSVSNIMLRNQVALDYEGNLQNVFNYMRLRRQLASEGMERLINATEKSIVDSGEIEQAYQAGVFDLLSREILQEEPGLRGFSGQLQEHLQQEFRIADNALQKYHRAFIANRISKNEIPAGYKSARVGELTQWALLRHECAKKTRHIPIRQLVKRAGQALLALKPCFMMGPMSVAQYLPPGELKFDLVIMDEASQIKPQDALGTVARGAQLIVVGDPKQLPPTSFFDRVIEDNEDDPTGIEESESILDAALPMFPARRLRWHYRSRHESLIAFSNHFFYDSDLVLFPSPDKQVKNLGITYSRVKQGCFINQKNVEEAFVIANAVRMHFQQTPEDSLGVVAMNDKQRQHIESAIESLKKDDGVFQEALERDEFRQDAFFIKNLENVQGDERDVVFISMTYGPQEPGGRVHQRFGPINSDMGWRRLNVLFTRSKKRMHIFSSMGSEDVLISPASKRGVKAMREFLSYCETGILHETNRVSGREPDSDFEVAVMTALRNEGFECVPQVGVSGYFIDLAVLDPCNSGRYLMGIECDGATYHSAKSTRDRDRLRQTVLERLGWRIRRIWSTDWFRDPKSQLAPIIQELKDLSPKIAVVETAD